MVEIRGITLDRDYSQGSAVFGNQKYANLAATPITLQVGEYLIDRWVGQQCFANEVDATGSSKFFNRFTVNQEAITVIIVRKLSHDYWSAWQIRRRSY